MFEKTRLVGRKTEIAGLDAEWERAARGELCCVLLTGDAGAGKTRLAEEVAGRLGGAAIALAARARPFGGAASFGLWAEAFEDHLRDLPAAEVSGLCGGLLDDLACLLRSVAAVRGGAPDREPPRTRLLESLGSLLRNLSRQRPVVLVLDDVHRADPSSWEALHYLALHYPRSPVLVLATARAGELADQPLAVRVLLDLEQQGTLRRVPVEPLDVAELREMTGDVLGTQAGEDVVDWVVERSRGNALFAVGLLRSLREEGGAVRPGLRLLPEELTERVRARVGFLDADAHGVLEMLAVAGGRVELVDLLRFLRADRRRPRPQPGAAHPQPPRRRGRAGTAGRLRDRAPADPGDHLRRHRRSAAFRPPPAGGPGAPERAAPARGRPPLRPLGRRRRHRGHRGAPRRPPAGGGAGRLPGGHAGPRQPGRPPPG
ncbi:MAG: AAA family ATPase, partial [Acidimicrobiia bacterium]